MVQRSPGAATMRPCEYQSDEAETCSVFDDVDSGGPMHIMIQRNRCTDAPDCPFYTERDVII